MTFSLHPMVYATFFGCRRLLHVTRILSFQDPSLSFPGSANSLAERPLQLSCTYAIKNYMCEGCNYLAMLEGNGVYPTPLREAVFRSIGEESRPLAAAEIMAAVRDRMSINKVTLYRILDLLVERGLVKRLSAGDRAFRYGMGETRHHPDHPHFVCRQCGVMECLEPEFLRVDLKKCRRKGKRIIRSVDIRFEGICETCLKAGK